ncbi:kinase-like domain-containing protein [Mycena olivaceomarginata]|nr:kinase-like domain-containing protein [Mycena olivaceomarginata]
MSTFGCCTPSFLLGDTPSDRMNRLLDILRSDEEVKVIKQLTGPDAQRFLDSAQEVLELEGCFPRPAENVLYRKACKLVDDLCGATKRLPGALFVAAGMLEFPNVLTHGGQSDIYLCERHRGLPGFPGRVVLKRLRIEGERYKELCRETLACRRLHHPSVLEFLGIDDKTFPEPYKCLISPYLQNGTIMEYRKKKGAANIRLLTRILEIAEGLDYIHGESLVHGDLHPGNILIDDEEHVKITDFGLATFLNATTTEYGGSKSSTITPGGTAAYMAPELLGCRMEHETTKLRKKSDKSDIFAFASVCYELYRGHRPLHRYPGPAIRILLEPKLEGGQLVTKNPWLRLPQPTAEGTSLPMPVLLWALVQKSWGISSARPTAGELIRDLGEAMNS